MVPSKYIFTLCVMGLIGLSLGQVSLLVRKLNPEKRIEYLVIATLDQCQGPDSSKYSLIVQYSTDSNCDAHSIQFNSETLTAGSVRDEKIVNHLQALGRGLYTQGANVDDEGLFFVQNGAGSLEGKYVYIRGSWLREDYLRKCSSILGYSYVSSKKMTLLIGDKLDLNVFLTTTGAFEVFKKSAQTVCSGHGYIF